MVGNFLTKINGSRREATILCGLLYECSGATELLVLLRHTSHLKYAVEADGCFNSVFNQPRIAPGASFWKSNPRGKEFDSKNVGPRLPITD
ncbi:hypothetical protein I7I50_05141 [Histoplasma capsulatum G186AR]|uniref:Uncharacterized protein n=1 Tax=Ajellomyces capsulatus TaxID=5037 RepID=A0A8H7ZC59_AJECA|nr:hypothetical protein I7I52_03399 [Histoplasma capsulatum]QSS75863.1 hypothetical protein I7I50_05141 [Histoplasma capsulatum G186AR]